VFTVEGQISVLTSIKINDVLCFVINVVELSLKLYIYGLIDVKLGYIRLLL